MISDSQTNTVYLADALRMDDAAEYRRFRKFLESHGVTVKVLDWTNDIYCRDYMPVQVDENDFVQFVFRPDYIKKDDYQYVSNPALIHMANDLKHIRYSNIILDGGNVVKWRDKVIISDKVLIDNKNQFESEEAIINQLKQELRCEVIIIPADKKDKTGHVDGMVRFIDENTVFINDPLGGSKKWQQQLLNRLNEHQLNVVKMPCTMKDGQKTGDGLYINYLHVGKLVVVPEFGPKQADQDALIAIEKELSQDNKIITYPANKIAKNGGVLNCATWTIDKTM